MPADYDIHNRAAQLASMATSDKDLNTSFKEEDTVKEFIVDQGALVALSNSLNQPQTEEGDLILVSLDTLQQLLSGNKRSREEFK